MYIFLRDFFFEFRMDLTRCDTDLLFLEYPSSVASFSVFWSLRRQITYIGEKYVFWNIRQQIFLDSKWRLYKISINRYFPKQKTDIFPYVLFAYVRFTEIPFFHETREQGPTTNSYDKISTGFIWKLSQVNLSIAAKKLCRIQVLNSYAQIPFL